MDSGGYGANGERELGMQPLGMCYLIPFKRVMSEVAVDPSAMPSELRMTAEQFYRLIKTLLGGISVDEGWYRATYSDVDEAIEAGAYKSAKHHFIENGYFEGRRPGPVVVDESWYLAAYPDVGEAIELGEIPSCQHHFDQYGWAEGRLPRNLQG